MTGRFGEEEEEEEIILYCNNHNVHNLEGGP